MFSNFFETLKEDITNPPTYFITSLAIMGAIALFSVIVGLRVKKLDTKAKPNGFLTLIISFVGFMNDYIKNSVGKHWKFLSPIVISMALYLSIANISGIAALDTPSRYLNITVSMSIIAIAVVQIMGFISKGWRHVLNVFDPLWPMFPLNIISDFTPIISMALRLFGNIVSGAVILYIVYSLTGWASLIIAPPFHILFDLGFGLIQAVVFVLLTIIFSSNKVDEKDLEFENNL